MRTALFTLSMLILLSVPTNAQQNTGTGNTLDDQFSEVYSKSNNYKEYKVVKKQDLNRLRSLVQDSVSALHSNIAQLNQQLNGQNARIDSLESSLSTTKERLSVSQSKENGIYLMGMLMQKSSYNFLMLGIIGALLILLLIFVARFRSSMRITREVRSKLADLETEFESFRQRSLEREQQIRRKLQDEINKNRGK